MWASGRATLCCVHSAGLACVSRSPPMLIVVTLVSHVAQGSRSLLAANLSPSGVMLICLVAWMLLLLLAVPHSAPPLGRVMLFPFGALPFMALVPLPACVPLPTCVPLPACVPLLAWVLFQLGVHCFCLTTSLSQVASSGIVASPCIIASPGIVVAPCNLALLLLCVLALLPGVVVHVCPCIPITPIGPRLPSRLFLLTLPTE